MHIIQTDRLTFNVRTSGSTDGVPLLLLHGSHATSRWWEPFFAILPDSVRAIAPDLRGCGQSTHSPSGYDIEDQAEDINGLVQALALSDFDLVGHGSGGAIAIEYALRYSQRLHSLILVDSVPVEGAFTPLQGLQILSQMRDDRFLLRQALSALFPTTPPPTMTRQEFDTFTEQLVDDAAENGARCLYSSGRGIGALESTGGGAQVDFADTSTAGNGRHHCRKRCRHSFPSRHPGSVQPRDPERDWPQSHD